MNADVLQLYTRLQTSLKDDVWHDGTYTYVTPTDIDGSSWRFLCYKWKLGTEKRLVVVNYSDTTAYARVVLDDAYEKADGDTVYFIDELNDVTYERSVTEVQGEGLFITLDAYKCHIFNY